MKAGYLRRNGSPTSDEANLTFHFIRHGDMLVVISELQDPIYLSEPLVLSWNFMLGTAAIRPIDSPCVPGEEATQVPGVVPHYLPGKNPFMDDMTKTYNIHARSRAGRSGNVVPRVPEETQG